MLVSVVDEITPLDSATNGILQDALACLSSKVSIPVEGSTLLIYLCSMLNTVR